MTSQPTLKLLVVILSSAVLAAGLVYVAVAAYAAKALVLSPCPCPGAAAHNRVDPSLLGPMRAADHARQLQPAVTSETYIYNETRVMCAKQDRVFRQNGKKLHSCFELCRSTPDCNHFSYVSEGKLQGRCLGCRQGLTKSHLPSTFFSIVRPADTKDDVKPEFTCPGFDSRTESQQEAIISLCETATSTSTSTSTGSTSSLSASSSSSTSTTSRSSSSSSPTSTSSSITTSSSSTSTSSVSTSSSSSTSTSSPSTSSSSSTSTRTQKVFVPKHHMELRDAVWMWMVRREEALAEYGHISLWSTSLIRDMSGLFMHHPLYASPFDDDISGWDVSNVEDMGSMFAYNFAFNQRISDWNVARVENMERMFWGATAFNQDISRWDVSSVSGQLDYYYGFVLGASGGMSDMFRGAVAFNKDISGWNVGNVMSMRHMFEDAKSFNQNISRWNVSNVRDMRSMFSGAEAFNADISAWDVSRVLDMNSAFENAISFNQDISGWDVSSVGKCFPPVRCGMHSMFYGAEAFNESDVDVSVWTPVSLRWSPPNFMPCSAASFRYGNWSSWGSKVPRCY